MDIETLPHDFGRWISEWLPGEIPREHEATCRDCAMCVPEAADPEQRGFDPGVKCCSFIPTLSNFLVGRILADESAECSAGRRSLMERMKTRAVVSPAGVKPSTKFSVLYAHSSAELFGRSAELLCPHYLPDTGGCSIWKYRNSTCTTWYCKHVRGAVGARFWRDLLLLLSDVESKLAAWCVLELDAGTAALRHVMPTVEKNEAARNSSNIDGEITDAAYAARWGAWHGRESKFYQQCAARVGALSWAQVLTICGVEVQIAAKLVEKSYAELVVERAPVRPRVSRLEVLRIDAGFCRLGSYSRNDPMDVHRMLFDVLPMFDGSPTKDALAAIAEKHDIELDVDVVRRLIDFGILEESGEQG